MTIFSRVLVLGIVGMMMLAALAFAFRLSRPRTRTPQIDPGPFALREDRRAETPSHALLEQRQGPPRMASAALSVPEQDRDATPRVSQVELLPELRNLSPEELEQLRRSAFVASRTKQAEDIGFPEQYRAKYVQVLSEDREKITELKNQVDHFEITPDEWNERLGQAYQRMVKELQDLYAEAGLKMPNTLAPSDGVAPVAATGSAQ